MYSKLEKIMQEKEITRNKLGKLSGIAPQDIYAAMSGNKRMFPGWKRRIADALGVPETELFDEDDD